VSRALLPSAPAARVRTLVEAEAARAGRCVLYWMTASRRTRNHFGLQHALARAAELGKPLLVLEALRLDYRWASARHHAFVLQGMADNRAACAAAGVAYHGYVEPERGAGRGLFAALARQAALVVADDARIFFLPNALERARQLCPVRLEAVDSAGLLPFRATAQLFPTAYAFRRHLQRALPEALGQLPVEEPLAAVASGTQAELPADVARRWPAASPELLAAAPAELARLALDGTVAPVATGGAMRGGERAARAALAEFVALRLARYAEERGEPASDAASGLSPWLHYGQLGVHEVLRAVGRSEAWTPARLGSERRGFKQGFWNLSASAEAFLDELVTWRELGLNRCAHQPDYARFQTLPDWARATLHKHAADARPVVYTQAELEAAATHDPLWNAAQRQLVREGRIHNYLRMLWGKKVLEWSATPEQAWETLIELNNRWALDGRDPNSYSGIAWCFGRFDRPWGPERPIFGTVRYMSSANTARKLDVAPYLARYASEAALTAPRSGATPADRPPSAPSPAGRSASRPRPRPKA